jgi:phage recombination protein Bet
VTAALALVEARPLVEQVWDREQINTIKQVLVPGATDTDLVLLAQVSKRTGLDLFTRQMYGIIRFSNEKQRDGTWKKVPKLTIQISIDGFRLIAERSGKYAGQRGPEWCGPDGCWRDVWLDAQPPAAARVGVLRTDWRDPLWAVARWDSYAEISDGKPTRMWAKMPELMLAKVAEALALRRAFPQELSGLYTTDELAQAVDEEGTPREIAPRDRRLADQVETSGPEPEATYAPVARAVVQHGEHQVDAHSGEIVAEAPDEAGERLLLWTRWDAVTRRAAVLAVEHKALADSAPSARVRQWTEALEAKVAEAEIERVLDGHRVLKLHHQVVQEAVQAGVEVQSVSVPCPGKLVGDAIARMLADLERTREAGTAAAPSKPGPARPPREYAAVFGQEES